MSEADSLRGRVLSRLRGLDGKWRTELCELSIDQLFGQRLRELIEPEALTQLLLVSLREQPVRRALERQIGPLLARHAQACAGSELRLRELVGPRAHDKLLALAPKLRLPPGRWARSAVDPALVRQLLGPVWSQVLVHFAKRLTLAGTGGAGARPRAGLTSILARSMEEQAQRLIDRGRSMMGGLGSEVERRLMAAARDFSDNAAQLFRAALIARVESDEGRMLVAEIVRGVIDQTMHARLSDLQTDLDALPLADILELVPDLVSHAVSSAFVEDSVQRELAAWLTLEADRTLGELLDESGSRLLVRELLTRQLDRMLISLAQRPAFERWIDRLLED
jgi:hypothetical protein